MAWHQKTTVSNKTNMKYSALKNTREVGLVNPKLNSLDSRDLRRTKTFAPLFRTCSLKYLPHKMTAHLTKPRKRYDDDDATRSDMFCYFDSLHAVRSEQCCWNAIYALARSSLEISG
jgi:hypothetical protein